MPGQEPPHALCQGNAQVGRGERVDGFPCVQRFDRRKPCRGIPAGLVLDVEALDLFLQLLRVGVLNPLRLARERIVAKVGFVNGDFRVLGLLATGLYPGKNRLLGKVAHNLCVLSVSVVDF